MSFKGGSFTFKGEVAGGVFLLWLAVEVLLSGQLESNIRSQVRSKSKQLMEICLVTLNCSIEYRYRCFFELVTLIFKLKLIWRPEQNFELIQRRRLENIKLLRRLPENFEGPFKNWRRITEERTFYLQNMFIDYNFPKFRVAND